jgi:hypothetical protein
LEVFYSFFIICISFIKLYGWIDESTDFGEDVEGFIYVWTKWGGDTGYCGRGL